MPTTKFSKHDRTDTGLPPLGHNQPPAIRTVPIDSIKLDPDDTRGFTDRDIKRAAKVEKAFGLPIPLLVGRDRFVRLGQLLWLAAKLNGRTEVPVVDAGDLTPLQERALSMALGRVLSSGKWMRDKQRDLLVQIIDEMPKFDLEATGFDMGEIDLILELEEVQDNVDEKPIPEGPEVAQRGEIYHVGPHRIACGDATDRDIYRALMGSDRAAAVFTDQPYGPKIAGFVSTKKRREFVQGSGDMSPAELEAFSGRYCEAMGEHVRPGAIVYLCMDWRGFAGLVAAARPTFGELIGLAVYKKDRAGLSASFVLSTNWFSSSPSPAPSGGTTSSSACTVAIGRTCGNIPRPCRSAATAERAISSTSTPHRSP